MTVLLHRHFFIDWRTLTISLASCFLSSCLHYGHLGMPTAEKLANTRQFNLQYYKTPHYDLFGAMKKGSPHEIHFYIEGDGLSWINGMHISMDPTPYPVTGFELATHDKSNATIIYLARPGQFIQDQKTTWQEWTYQRYSSEVINTYAYIFKQLSSTFPNAAISIYGYSGGGAVALLMAAMIQGKKFKQFERPFSPYTINFFVEKVVTFSGMLDHKSWTNTLQIADLTHSFNPPDYADILSTIPQVHFAGEIDTIVPISVTESYLNALTTKVGINLIVVKGQDHWNKWGKFWSNASENS